MGGPISVLLMTSKSFQGFNIAPPIGLCRLKNYLEKNNIKCDILDFDIDSEQSYIEKTSSGSYDIIGISVAHINMDSDLNTILKFRKASEKSKKNCKFIAGGQEASLNYNQWLASGLIDLIFLGYAEESLKFFCERFSCVHERKNTDFIDLVKDIDGVVFLNKDKRPVYSPSPPLTVNEFRRLSFEYVIGVDMPYLRYWEKIKSDRIGVFNNTEFIFETSRLYTTSHCPRRCGFCSSQNFIVSSQQKPTPIILLSAEDIHKLVLDHIARYGTKGFLFSDDDFVVGNKVGIDRVYEFCKLVIDSKKKGRMPKDVRFFCQSRILDYLDNKNIRWSLLEAMKGAGFDNTGLGIESFSDRLLKTPSINKVGVTVEDYRRVLDALLKTGIIPIIFIIVGIPESTIQELIETMYSTIEYFKKGADISVTARLRVNPGSPLCGLGGYETSSKTWKNPVTGDTIVIEDYFIPRDKKLASVLGKIEEAAVAELENIKRQRGWSKTLFPKSLIGITTFIATAKLINRQDVADNIARIMNEILDNQPQGA